MELEFSLIILSNTAQDSPRSRIQILTAFLASAISIHELVRISGDVGAVHCSSIDSMVERVVELVVE
jgi:hypothetical protein